MSCKATVLLFLPDAYLTEHIVRYENFKMTKEFRVLRENINKGIHLTIICLQKNSDTQKGPGLAYGFSFPLKDIKSLHIWSQHIHEADI